MPDHPDPLRGRRPLTRPRVFALWLPPERQPLPCHPRMSAILVMDPDAPLEFWEYPCQAAECERLYRFMREDGWLEWEPIDGFTVPDEKLTWSRPIDTFAVLERRLRERRPAATDHTLSRDEKVAASAA